MTHIGIKIIRAENGFIIESEDHKGFTQHVATDPKHLREVLEALCEYNITAAVERAEEVA